MLREGGEWQRAWKAINECNKPVIACMQGGCFGAALEMVAFADVRFCTEDCVFQAPEVDLGLAADFFSLLDVVLRSGCWSSCESTEL